MYVLCGGCLGLSTYQCPCPTKKSSTFYRTPFTLPCPTKAKNPTPSMNMVDLQAKYDKMNNTIPKQYKYIISK